MARTRSPFATRPAFENLEKVARELRLEAIQLCQQAKTPLPGTSLSCIELLIALYWNTLRIDPKHPDDPNRDRFIFNKSCSVSVLYAVLARRGFFPVEELKQYNLEGSRLAQHPTPGMIPGLEWSIGLPGRALGVGQGMALAAQMLQRPYRIYLLMDEREFRESSLQEPAKIASQLRLGNLTVIVEANASSPRADRGSPALRWQSRGWDTQEVDGHDIAAIGKILQPQRTNEHPLAVIAYTNKDQGSGCAGNDLWENRPPTAEEVETAKKELAL